MIREQLEQSIVGFWGYVSKPLNLPEAEKVLPNKCGSCRLRVELPRRSFCSGDGNTIPTVSPTDTRGIKSRDTCPRYSKR